MKQAGVLLQILWRATILAPFAWISFLLVLVYLVGPLDCLLYALVDSPWYWLLLFAWLYSFYLLQKPLTAYFRNFNKGDEAGTV